MDHNNLPETEKLISSFTEITSSSIKVAIYFLGTNQWNLNAAVSNFFEANDTNPSENELLRRDRIEIPDSSSSSSDDSLPPLLFVRSRSPSDPSRFHYCLRPKLPGEDPYGCRTIKRRRYRRKVRTLDYLSDDTNTDSDEAKESNDEGDKSEMLEQDPGKAKDVDAVLVKANESAMERPIESSRSMSGETVSAELQEEKLQDQSHDVVTSTVTIWKNGFTIDDSQLKSLDDPENVAYLESITSLESSRVLSPVRVQVKLIRREEENFNESPASDSVSTEPTISIKLRLADGTRLVSRFNTHHTVRDVRDFIDVTRPDDSKDYQLLIMGFPPKLLSDLDQTIEKACIANSVLIQKY
ncbi:Plant UBX domain-containing protein 5 [Cardamine amara subsp. amara]|uniref:Plant UBX domain-containing protein 5 n=1 Tax=Cardamine amara subsp. amara TaxID=228776 RepID=A0ABD0ZUB2_CARAN